MSYRASFQSFLNSELGKLYVQPASSKEAKSAEWDVLPHIILDMNEKQAGVMNVYFCSRAPTYINVAQKTIRYRGR